VEGVSAIHLFYPMNHPQQNVFAYLQPYVKITAQLAMVSLGLVFLLAAFFVVLRAPGQPKILQLTLEHLMILLLSLPSLFVAPLLIFLFSYQLKLFDSALLAKPSDFVLPALALALRPAALLAQMFIRRSQIEARQDYVRTAKAKGLSRMKIWFTHIGRNSAIPLVSYLPAIVTTFLSGSFLIEYLFALPGLGTVFVSALSERDYSVVFWLTLGFAAISIVSSEFFRWVTFCIDPRQRDEL